MASGDSVLELGRRLGERSQCVEVLIVELRWLNELRVKWKLLKKKFFGIV